MEQTTTNINPEDSKRYLDLTKHVLKSVSGCSQQLFEKELKKSENLLLEDDLRALIDWVLDTFTSVFEDLEHKVKQWFAYLFGENVLQNA